MKQIQKCMTGLFIAYMMISGNMMAQQVKVRGIVVDSLTRIGEPYATVRIYSAEND